MNSLNWKFFTPLALAGLVFTAIAEKAVTEYSLNRVLIHLGGNFVLIVVVLVLLRTHARARRRELEGLAIRDSNIQAVEIQP